MNDSDTEFVDRSVVENKDSDMHVDEEPETTSNDAHSNLSQLIYLFKLF